MGREKSAPFLILGIIAFLGFVMELVIGIAVMSKFAVIGEDFTPTISQAMSVWLLIYLMYGSLAFALHKVAKNKFNFNMFQLRGQISALNILLIIVMCSLHILYATYSWDWTLKPLAEYNGFFNLFGADAWIPFIGQIVYYFFEGLMMMVVIAFGQKFGELKFGKKNIPWGGVLLAITWGLFHYVTKLDVATTVSCFIIGIYFGICYLLLKKNALYSWLLFWIVYAL